MVYPMIESTLDFYDAAVPDSIAPENRGVAQLQSSHYVTMGRCFRVISDWDGVTTVTMLMHPTDIASFRYDRSVSPWSFASIRTDQEIADILEQLFAEQEVSGNNKRTL